MSEQTYLNALQHVLDHGESRPDRTGTGALSVFGYSMTFDTKGSVPLLTTKRVPWRMVVQELMWFIHGNTDSKWLEERRVNIWKGNTSRAFLDARGLADYPEGDIGPGYGFQWRHCGARYNTCKDTYEGQGFDQLEYVLQCLRTDPFSRRICMSAWNPNDLGRMALPPCHVFVQFYVDASRQLHAHLYQRSADMFLGFPWNMFSYAVLIHILAKKSNLTPGRLTVSIGDMHIYKDHLEQVKEQCSRELRPSPTLNLSEDVANKAWQDLSLEDVHVSNYNPHPPLHGHMSI